MPDDPFSDLDRPSDGGSDEANPFEDASTRFDEPPRSAADLSGEDAGVLPAGLNASLALKVARSWVSKHQEASMLGAFAVGIVLGRLFRN